MNTSQLSDSFIPKGPYCYTPDTSKEAEEAAKFGVFKIHPCPYWERYNQKTHGELPEELKQHLKNALFYEGAYCKFLKTGDWEPDGTMLLWDQVKECGINDDWEDEES